MCFVQWFVFSSTFSGSDTIQFQLSSCISHLTSNPVPLFSLLLLKITLNTMSSNHVSEKESNLPEVPTTNSNPSTTARSHAPATPNSVGSRTQDQARRRGVVSPKRSSSKCESLGAAANSTANIGHTSLAAIPTARQLQQAVPHNEDTESNDNVFDPVTTSAQKGRALIH